MPGLETDAVLALLREVASEVITPRFRHLTEGQVMEKGPGDLVTVADREAEVLVTRRLRDAYPDAVVLGEEANALDPGLLDRYAAAEHAFTVDPVDGTRNFVEGRPAFAVMVAEVVGPDVVRAWIHQPALGHDYVAERGWGTYRDGVRLAALLPEGDGDLDARVSRPELTGSGGAGVAPMRNTWWSCGVDYPFLAAGEVDGLVYRGGGAPWDHAPGSLLVGEVGGHVGRLDGTTYDPRQSNRGIVAARSRAAYDTLRAAAATW